ncbi:MAG: epoxide hydrolase 1 [Myxococcales bacterium]|nr:epoxide hydrolase 1 [Myxococcales bacterium]
MTQLEPTAFTIAVPETELQNLKQRLRATRFPDAETVGDWSQGIPLGYVRELCAYWAEQYDWRAREAALNRFGHFKLEVDGCEVHFQHLRSPNPDALPLIMTHGWPGSIVEFQKVIAPLTDPESHGGSASDAFHLVCPSLPGFAFSGKPGAATGWGVERIADAWNTLMLRLGYDRYVAQGGDWGSMVSTTIGARHPDHCAAIHLTMPIVAPDPATLSELRDVELAALASLDHYRKHDSGYSKQQSTRPQTLGYALADSPAGQAAWILEKFWAWTDCDGHPENVLSRDELLDNVMLYWLTNSATSSARLYWESFGSFATGKPRVPVGISIFPKEIFRTSERWARKHFGELLHYNALDRGGHFAAFEQPELFIEEMRNCFRSVR